MHEINRYCDLQRNVTLQLLEDLRKSHSPDEYVMDETSDGADTRDDVEFPDNSGARIEAELQTSVEVPNPSAVPGEILTHGPMAETDTERNRNSDSEPCCKRTKLQADFELSGSQRLSTFDPSKLTVDKDCLECKVSYRDPAPEELIMYLHAYRYKVWTSYFSVMCWF